MTTLPREVVLEGAGLWLHADEGASDADAFATRCGDPISASCWGAPEREGRFSGRVKAADCWGGAKDWEERGGVGAGGVWGALLSREKDAVLLGGEEED